MALAAPVAFVAAAVADRLDTQVVVVREVVDMAPPEALEVDLNTAARPDFDIGSLVVPADPLRSYIPTFLISNLMKLDCLIGMQRLLGFSGNRTHAQITVICKV